MNKFLCAALLAASVLTSKAMAYDVIINELFWDAPTNLADKTQAYIELRGTPGQSLNGYYLIMTENENNSTSGQIDVVFDLAGKNIGTNGFLLLLPNGFDRQAAIAPGTAVYQNTQSVGFGSTSSSIGFECAGGDGDLENGAFSVLLIKADSKPVVGTNLDAGREAGMGTNGRLSANKTQGWLILDSVGQAEPSEAGTGSASTDCYTYGAKVFFTQLKVIKANRDTITANVWTDLEPEHMFRWGGSTGFSAHDWAMANITNNEFKFAPSQYVWTGYVLSGNHVPTNPLPGELVRGMTTDENLADSVAETGHRNMAPEGTVIQGSLGMPNYPCPYGDLNEDGVVGYDDLAIIIDNFGVAETGLLGCWAFGDITGDGIVDLDDFYTVLNNFTE